MPTGNDPSWLTVLVVVVFWSVQANIGLYNCIAIHDRFHSVPPDSFFIVTRLRLHSMLRNIDCHDTSGRKDGMCLASTCTWSVFSCFSARQVGLQLFDVAVYRIHELSDKYRTRILLIKFTGASTSYLGYMSLSNVLHGNCKGGIKTV
jgi:hypothetical protein